MKHVDLLSRYPISEIFQVEEDEHSFLERVRIAQENNKSIKYHLKKRDTRCGMTFSLKRRMVIYYLLYPMRCR